MVALKNTAFGEAIGITMVVQRMTMRVKAGRMEEWVAVLKTNLAKAENREFSRLYISHSDPELMVQDLEFEDLAARDKFWEEWKKTPEHAAIGQAWDKLGLEELGTEYWTPK